MAAAVSFKRLFCSNALMITSPRVLEESAGSVCESPGIEMQEYKRAQKTIFFTNRGMLLVGKVRTFYLSSGHDCKEQTWIVRFYNDRCQSRHWDGHFPYTRQCSSSFPYTAYIFYCMVCRWPRGFMRCIDLCRDRLQAAGNGWLL